MEISKIPPNVTVKYFNRDEKEVPNYNYNKNPSWFGRIIDSMVTTTTIPSKIDFKTNIETPTITVINTKKFDDYGNMLSDTTLCSDSNLEITKKPNLYSLIKHGNAINMIGDNYGELPDYLASEIDISDTKINLETQSITYGDQEQVTTVKNTVLGDKYDVTEEGNGVKTGDIKDGDNTKNNTGNVKDSDRIVTVDQRYFMKSPYQRIINESSLTVHSVLVGRLSDLQNRIMTSISSELIYREIYYRKFPIDEESWNGDYKLALAISKNISPGNKVILIEKDNFIEKTYKIEDPTGKLVEDGALISKIVDNSYKWEKRKNGVNIIYFPKSVGDGKVVYEIVTYVDGKLWGESKEFFQNGVIRHTIPYFDGVKHGIEIEYSKAGNPISKGYFILGEEKTRSEYIKYIIELEEKLAETIDLIPDLKGIVGAYARS